MIQKSIILLFSIIQNHPFVDGNKRTGLECMDIFIDFNRPSIRVYNIKETEDIIIKIAKNEISKNKVRKWIESCIVDD